MVVLGRGIGGCIPDEQRLAHGIAFLHVEAVEAADDIASLGADLCGVGDRLADAADRVRDHALADAWLIAMDMAAVRPLHHRLLPGKAGEQTVQIKVVVLFSEPEPGFRNRLVRPLA